MPKHGQVLTDGQPIVLGDLAVTPFSIAGHTPGAMGFIFPVKDNGRTHIAAMWGGTILTQGPIPDEGLQTYLKSIQVNLFHSPFNISEGFFVLPVRNDALRPASSAV